MDPFVERSLCAFGYSGWPNLHWPNAHWDSSSNFNAPSLNPEPGVAFPNKILSPVTEPSTGSEFTIEKKLASANKRIGVAEDEEVILNDSKGPSITDQVGRGAHAAILEAFQRPVFTTSSDIYMPRKRTLNSTEPKTTKKSKKLLQKLQFA